MQPIANYVKISELFLFKQISNRILSYLTFGVVVAGFLISSKVDLLTSIRTVAVLCTISSTGLVIWLAMLRKERPIYFPEAIGMGLALGFIACASLMLLLRPLGFDYYGALAPIAALNSYRV